MKILIRIAIIVTIFLAISVVIPIEFDNFFINTIFTVAGIMFSVGLGLIVTFNIGYIKNKSYIIKIRGSINNVRNSFLKYFTLVTICYVLDYYLRQSESNITTLHVLEQDISLNWSILFCLLMIYSIVYFIINFIEIQKLNNDIVDKLIKENNSNKLSK